MSKCLVADYCDTILEGKGGGNKLDSFHHTMCPEAKNAYLGGLVGEDPGCLLGLLGAQGSFGQPEDKHDACSEAMQSEVC